MAKSFINLLYPMHCLGCSAQLDALNEFNICGHCVASIKPNVMPPFELDTPSVKAYSACIYEGTLKELIHSFKYKGKLALARIFSRLMAEYIKENPELAAVDIVTAVPLHRSRYKQREFNQSLVLANKVAKEFGLRANEILEKTRKTICQNELSKSERLTNLKKAFRLRKDTVVKGKNILLIDDVMTTGATLNECARALKAAGAHNVFCFTLARSI